MDSLKRFDVAQFDTYEIALAELAQGRKVTHWMWFIFPQLKALGHSSTAKYYGIADLREARAYLADPDLGPRLLQTSHAVLAHTDKSADQIFGKIDALKFRSSATLFREAAMDSKQHEVFQEIISNFFDRKPCTKTLDLLRPTQSNRCGP